MSYRICDCQEAAWMAPHNVPCSCSRQYATQSASLPPVADSGEAVPVAERARRCADIYEDAGGPRNLGAASALRQFAADIETATPPPSSPPVGYVIGTYLTERRREYEQHGATLYHAPMGTATTPVYATPPSPSSRPGGEPDELLYELKSRAEHLGRGGDISKDDARRMREAADRIEQLTAENRSLHILVTFWKAEADAARGEP